MKKISILYILLFSFICCCYSQKREIVSVNLNTPLSSEIGEAVVSTGEVIKTDAIQITETFEVKSGFTKFQHIAGEVYPIVFIKNGFKIYYLQSSLKDGRYWGIGVSVNNPDEIYPIVASIIKVVAKMKNYEVKNNVKKTVQVSLCDNCYRQEFIYSGKVGNIVKFEYREFIGDMARPSFFQNLEYDISENEIVGFKGLRLKILKTSNISISYEVLESFKPLR
ncbi:MAG: hypothetical protein M1445_15880 [Bacteroidetes bacterium]|nr:hypothetical protein [Bacteroidota bacterium]MCL6102981.1 hypothetical protein [Bacteroidota bacterium]